MKPTSHRAPALVLSLLLAALPLSAQLTPQADPANLAGERVSAPSLSDTLPIDHGALALQQLLRKLGTRASFMLIVAHPDDEDGGMLTYLSRGQGARVAMLTLNRGEGGQNLMSGDFEDALGLIRTQELLAADRYMGVDQLFGTEVDFGFSKTKEEAFSKWTHDRVLYDAVRAVRLYRPLVIASVFIGAPSDGHGQHQVSGEIAQEVFNAAGDPTIFPDQIAAGLQPWQPLKVYARVPFARIDAQGMFDYATNQYTPARFTNYVTGKVTTTIPRANIVIHEGTSDPILGNLSYVQFAREGLALQKTQIGPNARLASPGPHDVAYHRYGSHLNQPDGDNDPTLEPSLFTSIDTSIQGIATLAPDAPRLVTDGLQAIADNIASAQAIFDPAHLERSAPPMRAALGSVDDLIRNIEPMTMLAPQQKFNLLHELHIKRVQLNDALLLAHGVSLTAEVTVMGKPNLPLSNFMTTQTLGEFHLDITANENSSIRLVSASISSPGKEQTIFTNKSAAPLPVHNSLVHALEFTGGLPATRPYFSRPNIEQPVYDIANPALRNAPATPDPLTASVTLDDGGVPLTLVATIGDPHANRAVVVVPPDSVSFSRSAGIIPIDKKDPMVWVESRIPISKCTAYISDMPDTCSQFAEASKVHLNLPSGWHTDEPTEALAPATDTLTQYEGFTLTPPALHTGDQFAATATAAFQGHQFSEGYRSVGYPGVTPTNYFKPATYRATAIDLQLPESLLVGFVKGTGDEVYDSLFAILGGHIQMLDPNKLTTENLKSYAAVILGVRAYESHPEITSANSALSAYAASGGVVIVQYVGHDLPAGSAPYPLSLGDNEKVVEEDAAVHILDPSNPLLNWPNKITSADFDHWVEERGHGFMATWDPHYLALLETHDHGQQPQRGGLLVAHTGKGAWIYLGLALYRQLPEGVPGAYRILANLISAAKNPAFISTPSGQ
jgi:LmbE family N-acetylglucosaminyl deacetylase